MSTILIVDDKPDNLYLLQVMLQGNGFEVLSAANGREALSQAREAPPDLIIADILMPGMDGFALCREWRRDPALREIPFVFYTATYTGPQDEQLALNLGADLFLVKPLEPDVLMDRIGRVLDERSAGRSSAQEAPPESETVVLEEYNQALVRKLEDKLAELDIALRKHAELERIVSLSPATVWLWRNAAGWPVEFVSDNVAQLGYEPEDFRSGRLVFSAIIHPDDLARVSDEQARYAQEDGRESFVQEYRLLTADGEVRYVDDRTWIQRDGTGEITHFHGILVDITERKQAEAKVAEQLDELRRWHEALIGREDRVLEVKKEVNELLARLGEPPRYPSALEG